MFDGVLFGGRLVALSAMGSEPTVWLSWLIVVGFPVGESYLSSPLLSSPLLRCGSALNSYVPQAQIPQECVQQEHPTRPPTGWGGVTAIMFVGSALRAENFTRALPCGTTMDRLRAAYP